MKRLWAAIHHCLRLTILLGFSLGLFSSDLAYAKILHQAQSTTSDQPLAAEILVYINQYRVQHGRAKLTMDPVLCRTAAGHSQDMAKHVVPFGHDGFNARMNYLHQHVKDSLSGAENVAYNYKTAKIVADGWLHSRGHQKNIMGNYNLTGIGIARDHEGKLYYTQMFLRQDASLAHGHTVVARSKSGKRWRKAFKGFVG